MPTPIPIIVGVAQSTIRSKALDDFVHPIEAMKRVVVAAAEDAECPSLVREADALHVVNVFSWNFRDAPGSLSEALNINPSIREYSAIGGNSPQWLVNRAADNLASGQCKIAILTGCEVMRSFKLAMKAGKDLGNYREKVEVTLIGITKPGTSPDETNHFADRPIRLYPIIENALRAKEGLSVAEQREQLGEFGRSYSAIAASNPYAWFPVARSADEITTPTPQNRMIAFPYTKYLNAVMEVDQAAAVIMTTTEKAQQLGIPKSKWVYVHGGQDATDRWFVSERPDIADSPAMQGCVYDSLDQSELNLDQIDFFDFYSCFPCMPRLSRNLLGIPHDDPRPMTITGGLPYFGGAGNNYVMHSIAEAVNRCRANPEQYGLVTANGYYCTKHSAGIYSAQETRHPWARIPDGEFQEALPLPDSLETDPEPSGDFTVEGYTVWHDPNGEPEFGILCGRTEADKRAWAQTPRENKGLMQAMMQEEWVGKRGRIIGRNGKINLVDFD